MKIETEVMVEGLISCWCRKLLANHLVVATRINRRYKCHMVAEEIEDNVLYQISYNPEQIEKDWDYGTLISGVIHEIGHIIYSDFKVGSKLDDIIDEYLAERFAVDTMKKYCPEHIKPLCKYMNGRLLSPDWRAKYTMHFQAFCQIEEYGL